MDPNLPMSCCHLIAIHDEIIIGSRCLSAKIRLGFPSLKKDVSTDSRHVLRFAMKACIMFREYVNLNREKQNCFNDTVAWRTCRLV